MTPRDARDPDSERDRWLAEALRHAPDANAAPSPELSEAILRQARNAVKTPVMAAPARAHPLLALWSWLARPPVAAGFASMMVAVLVGVMWWDKPIDDTLPPRAGGVATAPAPEAAPAETAPPPVVAPSPAPPGARANATADATAAKPASPAAAAERRAAADRAPPAEARKRANADMTARSEAKSEAPSAPQQPPPPPEKEAAAQPPGPTPAPFPAATPPAATTAPARARDEAAEPRAAAGTLAKSAPLGAAATQRLQADTRANVLGIPAERWSWRRDAEPHAMTAALQRWLAQLEGIARWQPASTAPPADAVTLRLAQDGTPHTTIAIGADAVWRLPAQGAALSAPLNPAAAATLKESLLAAAP